MRFVRLDESTGCWVWQGATTQGYGRFQYLKKSCPAHRMAYELFVAPIPPDLCVCHKCDVPLCVNPAHLFLGTHADNVRDRDAKGRNHMAARTHCPYGHPLSGDNLIASELRRGCGRVCRTCKYARNRAAYARNRATK